MAAEPRESVLRERSKGYRVGGVNVGVGTICGGDLETLGLLIGSDGLRHVPTQFASDSLWSYELGGKNTFLDHRLQIDTSLFVINWKNIQQNVYLPSCGEQFTANLGQVQSRGGDIDVQFRPIDTLMLGLTVAYTDARYQELLRRCAPVRPERRSTRRHPRCVHGRRQQVPELRRRSSVRATAWSARRGPFCSAERAS